MDSTQLVRVHLVVDAANFFLTFGNQCLNEAWLREIHWKELCDALCAAAVPDKPWSWVLSYGVGLPAKHSQLARQNVPYRSDEQIAAVRNAGGEILEGFLRPREGKGGGNEEKGVDTAMVGRLAYGAGAGDYDVAIMLTGDADFAPCVTLVCEAGKRVVVASWRGTSTAGELVDTVERTQNAAMLDLWSIMDKFVPHVKMSGANEVLDVAQFRMWKALLDAEETKNARGVDHVLLDYMRTEVSIDGIEPDSDQRVQRYTLFQVLLNAGHIRRYGVGERNETALAVVRRNADSNTGS